MLPPLSQRLRAALRTLAAQESYITSESHQRLGFSAPDLLQKTTDLVNETLVRVMNEIEKGPGGPRQW